MSHLNERFDDLIEAVQACRACQSMDGCTRVLSWANGTPDAEVMFVGEAPGRLGADRTAIPFHGDIAGDNFEKLLALSGLSRAKVFITNAVLCNPRDAKGNNAPPSRSILKQCATNLRQQIEVIRPRVLVTLGAAALESTRLIEDHDLTLARDVRTVRKWNGTNLVPFYHPGARAMIHRNYANQSADYYFLGEFVRRMAANAPKAKAGRAIRKTSSWDVVHYIIKSFGNISLFKLHKILYLLDYRYLATHGQKITDFLYIRQKDGPYCVELGSRWFKTFSNAISTSRNGGSIELSWIDNGLFDRELEVAADIKFFINALVLEALGKSEAELKTTAYLTKPMKASLRAEREGIRQLNKPLI